jgi:hypothetical protein
MTPAPINNFDDVILFELQKKVNEGKYAELTFSELWKASVDAAPGFWAPVNPHSQRKQFVARLMEALSILTKCEYVAVNTNAEDNVESVRLLASGLVHVSQIVYTNQNKNSIPRP